MMLAILLSLGTWQLYRRSWKHARMAHIAAAMAAPGVPLGQNPPEFQKVSVTGVLRPTPALYAIEVRDTLKGPIEGAQLLDVLDQPTGPVLVDRGWVAIDAVPKTPVGQITIEGFVRPPEHPGMLSVSDDPVKRRFFTLDPVRIGAAIGADVPPFTVVALGPQGNPDPARAPPELPDNHLNYAITWYAFAFNLVVVFGIYARKVLRS